MRSPFTPGRTIAKLMRPPFTPRRTNFRRYAAFVIFIVALFFYLDPRYPRSPTTQLRSQKSKSSLQVVAPNSSHSHPQPDISEKPLAGSDLISPVQRPNHDDAAKPVAKPVADEPEPHASDKSPPHPIEVLIQEAEGSFNNLLKKESKTLNAAAQAYRERRHRHPPPGFDSWFRFAQEHNSIIVEDFFDQIYHDLQPFWGFSPSRMRKEAAEWEMVINVRSGSVTTQSDWFWAVHWVSMMKDFEHLLPDMDIALNPMDEPRVVVPFEDMQRHLIKAADKHGMPEPKKVQNTFRVLPDDISDIDPDVKPLDKRWDTNSKQYWLVARRGCPPDSLARKTEPQDRFDQKPTISTEYPKKHMRDGFMVNITLSKELCHQPDLQGLNGIFIEPRSISTTAVLFPMFGGSKLAVNNEILLPAAMYWANDLRFKGDGYLGGEWADKENIALWRGVASGGFNRPDNWRGFQRHRFVDMNNETKVTAAEEGAEELINFSLPEKIYRVAAEAVGGLGKWIGAWSDVSFTDLSCELEGDGCDYVRKRFHVADNMWLSSMFRAKYLPDIDGNSYSGRYLSFLRSTSLPIKATLWVEWHDTRLIPWKHYVPMDSRFGDYYGIMDYFLGFGDKSPGHDAEAEKIAAEGKAWAEKVLRPEDIQIYTLRLLLEYARLSDERREEMGWVGDLLETQTPSS